MGARLLLVWLISCGTLHVTPVQPPAGLISSQISGTGRAAVVYTPNGITMGSNTGVPGVDGGVTLLPAGYYTCGASMGASSGSALPTAPPACQLMSPSGTSVGSASVLTSSVTTDQKTASETATSQVASLALLPGGSPICAPGVASPCDLLDASGPSSTSTLSCSNPGWPSSSSSVTTLSVLGKPILDSTIPTNQAQAIPIYAAVFPWPLPPVAAAVLGYAYLNEYGDDSAIHLSFKSTWYGYNVPQPPPVQVLSGDLYISYASAETLSGCPTQPPPTPSPTPGSSPSLLSGVPLGATGAALIYTPNGFKNWATGVYMLPPGAYICRASGTSPSSGRGSGAGCDLITPGATSSVGRASGVTETASTDPSSGTSSARSSVGSIKLLPGQAPCASQPTSHCDLIDASAVSASSLVTCQGTRTFASSLATLTVLGQPIIDSSSPVNAPISIGNPPYPAPDTNMGVDTNGVSTEFSSGPFSYAVHLWSADIFVGLGDIFIGVAQANPTCPPPGIQPPPVRSGQASSVLFDGVTLGGRPVPLGDGVCDAGPVSTTEAPTVHGAGMACAGTVVPMAGVSIGANSESLGPQPGNPSGWTAGSRISSLSLLPGALSGADVLTVDSLDASSSVSCALGRPSSRSSIGSLVIAGQRIATQPVGSRVVFNPTGKGAVTLYGNPVSVNPTGARIPMAIVTLNYSRYDPARNEQVSSPVEVEFPQGGPLSAYITGRIFLSYAKAACA